MYFVRHNNRYPAIRPKLLQNGKVLIENVTKVGIIKIPFTPISLKINTLREFQGAQGRAIMKARRARES